MYSELGKIPHSNDNYSLWDIKWSDIKKILRDGASSIRSPIFELVIGTCCFEIQLKFHSTSIKFIYLLKLLKLSSKNVVRPIQLKINEVCVKHWINNEEPCFVFKHSSLRKKSRLMISCLIKEKSAKDSIGDLRFEDLSIALSIPPIEEAKVDDAASSKSTSKLIEDLKEAFLTGNHSDVVLKVEGKEFKAHRSILGLRSPVFSAMFEHEMKEKISGMVTIEDCDPETFPDFLHYVYTGSVEKLSNENAPRLYVAADRYQLLELKEECLECMKNNVSVDNFCDIMSLALRHHETELTSVATQFFLQNASDIVVTTKWMIFLTENVVVGNELIVKLASDRQTK